MDKTAKKRPKRSLVTGRMMTCPRCKKPHDILQYVPLRMIEEFMEETTPVYKCPSCRWIFAPAEDSVINMLSGVASNAEDHKRGIGPL